MFEVLGIKDSVGENELLGLAELEGEAEVVGILLRQGPSNSSSSHHSYDPVLKAFATSVIKRGDGLEIPKCWIKIFEIKGGVLS